AYVVDMNNCNVQKFDKQGKFLLKFGSQGEDEGQFLHPHSIALDSSGNLYVVEQGNFRMQKFHCNGKFITACGPDGSDGNQFSDHTL
ncbi:MAG TPA: 6-bladed beta-propeller, partial [Nitrososphaeraceae archaeon]